MLSYRATISDYSPPYRQSEAELTSPSPYHLSEGFFRREAKTVYSAGRRLTVSCPKLIWSLFASYFEVFRVKVQPLCLRRTEGANNHIKKNPPRLFTSDSVGVPYY